MDFHLNTRALQQSRVNDSVYGYCSPFSVKNRDQIPICLAASYAKTVDDTGAEVIWDSTKNDSDEKRFCTLDLEIPMKVKADRSNVRKPHVIFFASEFRTAEEWEEKQNGVYERDMWDPRVLVSFQKHAWMDSRTNIHGIVNAGAACGVSEPEVKFEDNLSSHKTEEVIEAWTKYLPNSTQMLFPANMTWCLQPIDRHIGKQYKSHVYKGIRSEMMRRLRACQAGELPQALTVSEKRVLITKLIAEKHEELLQTGAFERAFIATGCWMPLDGSRDAEVDLQGVSDYKYAEVCTPSNINKRAAELEAERDKEKAKRAQELKAQEAKLLIEENLCVERDKQWQPTHDVLLPMFTPLLDEATKATFAAVAAHLRKSFVCYGSYPAYVFATCLAFAQSKTPPSADMKPIKVLPFDDIDIAHGTAALTLERGNNYQKFDLKLGGIVNLVFFEKLNPHLLLRSADINAVAMVAHVETQGQDVKRITWHIGSALLEFLLKDQTLRVLRTENPAQSLVRMAYKAWKHGLPFDRADWDPEEGQLFAAQVVKVTVLTVYYRNIVNIATAMCINLITLITLIRSRLLHRFDSITIITIITLITLITLIRSLYIIGP